MSKNVVFMLSPWLLDGTLNSWKYWCNKYDVTLFNLKETITHDMPVSWQKYYLFDVLDHNKIDYNQVLIVDNNTIIHPECPNFFKKTDGKYCIVPDETNYNEIIKGMGFLIDKIFKKEDFPFYECGNTGFQIVNKNHKKLFGLMIDYYYENVDIINSCGFLKITPEQLFLNFILRNQKIDLKLLPWKFNMTYMHVKEIIGNSMIHTKVGHIMNFNGLPKKTISDWVEMTYNHLYNINSINK